MPIDYERWDLSIREVTVLIGVSLVASFAVGWLFFDNGIIGMAVGTLLLLLLPKYKQWRIEKRRKQLLIQFRDLLYSIASSIAVGRNLTQALEESSRFWQGTYSEDDLIMVEVRYMLRRINESNETDLTVLKDFAKRSGLSEIMDFAMVYENCKTSGADLMQAIRRAATVIGDRIGLEQELVTMLSQKKFECRIVMSAPFLLLLFLKLMSPDYLVPMFESTEGRFISLSSLLLIVASCLLMERVMKIEI